MLTTYSAEELQFCLDIAMGKYKYLAALYYILACPPSTRARTHTPHARTRTRAQMPLPPSPIHGW